MTNQTEIEQDLTADRIADHRLECLKLACGRPAPEDVLPLARAFYEFVVRQSEPHGR